MANEECTICLDPILVSSTGRVELSCNHTFHLKCISTWFGKTNQCPNCRTTASEMETIEKPVQNPNGLFYFYQYPNSSLQTTGMTNLVNLNESAISFQSDNLSYIEENAGAWLDSLQESENPDQGASADAPNTDAPNTDAPSTDAPSTDAPNTEVPGMDALNAVLSSYANNFPLQYVCIDLSQANVYRRNVNSLRLQYSENVN